MPLIGTLEGPAVALYDVDVNENDVEAPLKGPRVGQRYYIPPGATIVEERSRFDLFDCLVCWYCPGVFLISRLCFPQPRQTVVSSVVVDQMARPGAQGVPMAPMAR